MKDSTGKFFAGVFIFIIILLVIGVAYNQASESDICAEENCYRSKDDGSCYCRYHTPGTYFYKVESYRKEKNTAPSTYATSSTYNYTPKKSYSTKSGSSYHSYDDGYDDVYFNEDYDMDRYYSDEDYARGVDDAMEDEDW